MIYLDTSAAMKLVRPEVHSAELITWLRDRVERPVLSSVIIEVELMRATRRAAPGRMDRAAEVLRGVAVVTVSQPVIDRATAYLDPSLRSLDAIHLATAEHVVFTSNEPLEAFVAYDARLLAAARHVGLPAFDPSR